MKIVQFENGKYAVCVGGLFMKVYLDKEDFYEWYMPEYVQEYCLCDTEAEARQLIKRYEDKRKNLSLKIVKKIAI